MPALAADDGSDVIGKPAGYGKAQKEAYTANRYHAPSDEVLAEWDMAGYAEDTKLLFAVGYRVAQAGMFPEWKPGNEFKSIRDKSLSIK